MRYIAADSESSPTFMVLTGTPTGVFPISLPLGQDDISVAATFLTYHLGGKPFVDQLISA